MCPSKDGQQEAPRVEPREVSHEPGYVPWVFRRARWQAPFHGQRYRFLLAAEAKMVRQLTMMQWEGNHGTHWATQKKPAEANYEPGSRFPSVSSGRHWKKHNLWVTKTDRTDDLYEINALHAKIHIIKFFWPLFTVIREKLLILFITHDFRTLSVERIFSE